MQSAVSLSDPVVNVLNALLRAKLPDINGALHGAIVGNHLDPMGSVTSGSASLGHIDLGICTAHADADYSISNLVGLSSFAIASLQITSAAAVPGDPSSITGMVALSAGLGGMRANLGGSVEAGCGIISPSVGIGGTATIGGASVNSVGTFTASVQQNQIVLSGLGVSNVSVDYHGVNVDIDGLGIFNSLLEPLTNLILDQFKGKIADQIASSITLVINNELAKLLPLSVPLLGAGAAAAPHLQATVMRATATTTFDVAAGITRKGLDALVASLYAVPNARQNLFRGRVNQDVPPLGNVTVTYDVGAAPTFVLSAPTDDQWKAAQKIKPDQPKPTVNAFQLLFSQISGSLTVGSSQPLAASGALTIFGVLDVTAGQAALEPVAVYVDESSFSGWDKVIVNNIIIPKALTLAQKLLKVSVPPIPSFLGLTFQPVVAVIDGDCVLAGATLIGGGTTKLVGITSPSFDVFALCTLNPINQVLASQVNGKTFSADGKSGPSTWYAAGKLTATNVQLSASIASTALRASASASISGYGELGGVANGIVKAVLCPIGAAVDAISNPSDWDKVIASFDLQYKPDPLTAELTITAGQVGTDGQPIMISIDKLDPSPQLILKPTWSGSVTGTVLGTAAAAFVDLVSVIFGTLIVKRIISDDGQDRTIYKLPPPAQTIEGVTATLTLAAQAVSVIAPDTLAQGLQIAFA